MGWGRRRGVSRGVRRSGRRGIWRGGGKRWNGCRGVGERWGWSSCKSSGWRGSTCWCEGPCQGAGEGERAARRWTVFCRGRGRGMSGNTRVIRQKYFLPNLQGSGSHTVCCH